MPELVEIVNARTSRDSTQQFSRGPIPLSLIEDPQPNKKYDEEDSNFKLETHESGRYFSCFVSPVLTEHIFNCSN